VTSLQSSSKEGDVDISDKVLTEKFTEPLNGAKSATINIDTRHGNLVVDRLDSGDQLLAAGTLEYLEKRGLPSRGLSSSNHAAKLTIHGAGGSRGVVRLPWQACNAATDWNIHLSPRVALEIDAVSGGGNVKLDLTGVHVTRVSAESGGGNMEVILPEKLDNLNVSAKSGAGNVSLQLPAGISARIHARTGLGKVVVDERFRKVDERTYESQDFDKGAHKVEITAESGAGNVTVSVE
jgi:hypothetical protein